MKILVTGSSGFIGSHLVGRLTTQGHEVIGFDQRVGRDLRSWEDCSNVIVDKGLNAIVHLAAQTAVTTSVKDPVMDFEVNVTGTFRLLETIRRHSPNTRFIYASTNKVYGEFAKSPTSESTRVSLETPYGCSKGAADFYVQDYCRIFGLSTVVFRQSCIYGPGQYGSEDQGWVGYFLRRIMHDEGFTVYGDGNQVRDLLFIDDLVDLFMIALLTEKTGVFNVGGGQENAVSVFDVISKINRLVGRKAAPSFGPARPADQYRYVSDISKVRAIFGWEPKVCVDDGLARMYAWAKEISK